MNTPLDVEAMQQAAQLVTGEHDFSSFRSAHCQARHAVRVIQQLKVSRHGDMVQVDITANGFLHNMVRILTGSLVKIGKHEHPVQWLQELLEARDRRLAGATLASGGLYFLQPRYPETHSIPDFSDRWGDR